MNKHLLYSAMLVAAVSANEAKAQVTAPDAPVPVQLNLDGKDTVYVYNVAAKLWLNAGNAWGTQTSLCAKGMKVLFVPNKSNGVPNNTYSLYNNSTSEWTRRVFYNGKDDNGGTSYVDFASGSVNKCNWEVYLNNEKKTFELQADTIEFKSETTCTRAGWNKNDPKKINQSGEKDATDEIFRPILDMKSANKADYGVEWMAVSQEGYDCYLYRKDEMMDIINKAIEAGINVGNAVMVYNDENSTLAQLKEAAQYVKDMTRNHAMESASSSNVIDITEYIPNADCNSATGWDIVCPDADKDGNKGSGGHGFTWRHGSGSYTADEDGTVCESFIERWVHRDSKYGSTNSSESDVNNGHLSNSSLSQTLKNLPKGGYQITAYVNACQQGKQAADASYRVDGVYFYAIAGGKEKSIKVATAAGKPQKVTLSVIVDGDTDLSELTFGMKTENTTANWVFLDDVEVKYFGSDAMVMAVKAAQDEAYTSSTTVDGYSCNQGYIDDVDNLYDDISNLDPTTATQEEVDELMTKFRAAVAEADKNVALYEKLGSLETDITLLVDNDKYDYADLKAAYTDCGIGVGYSDLFGSYDLNNEEVSAYIERLQSLIASTRKSAIKVGEECTEDVLQNSSFETNTGWNNTGVTINTTYKNAESYQGTFNLYQDLTELPEGVYEITVQAMQRVDNNDNASQLYPNDVDEMTAYLYGNDITAKFASPYSYGMAEQKVTSGNADYAFNGKYIPNSMEGFAAACAESKEAYLTKVYALVTDGNLRVGVKEEARPAGHSGDWAIFDNFKITYLGDDAKALQTSVTPLLDQANALLAAKMYEGKKSSLQKVVDAVNTTLNMDNIKALALEIKNALAAIDAYKPLASAIENVKARYESNETTATTSAEAKAIYNASLKTAEDAYNNGTVAEENIEAAIKDLNKGYTQYFIYDVVAAAENGASVDISKVINNYDFGTMDKTGWTIKVTQNAAGGFQKDNNVKAVEFYDNKGFDLYQELVGMPAGTYKLSARAYYRLRSGGNIDDAVNAFVYYANSKETDAEPVAKADVKSIYAGAITQDELSLVNLTSTDGMSAYNGTYYVPNNMTTGQRFLTSDEIGPKYDSEEITFDYDGTSPFYIGVANTNTKQGNDWAFVKSFKLSYVKGTTGVENINGEKAGDVVSTKIYDINGVQYNSLKPGVNIVKSVMSDGSVKVRKVVVK